MTTAINYRATASVKGGFWPENGVNSLTGIALGSGALRRRAAFALSRRSMLAMREEALTLNGATAGSAALATVGRIEANEELGGKRTVETLTLLDDTTVAADKTRIDEDLLAYGSYTASPPANLDGSPLGELR